MTVILVNMNPDESLPGGSMHRHRNATYNSVFKRCWESVAHVERSALILMQQLLLCEFWFYAIVLAWRPILTELSTYCKSGLHTEHMEARDQSLGTWGRRKLFGSYRKFTRPKSCLTKLFGTYFPQYCVQVRMPWSERKANQLDKEWIGWLVLASGGKWVVCCLKPGKT